VPGHAVVTFTQPGGYVLYVERPGSCCSFNIGSSGGGPPFSGWSMRLALLPVSGGSAGPLLSGASRDRPADGPAAAAVSPGRQACAGYELGARCDLAAARDSAGFNSTAAKPLARFRRLLNCSTAGMNKGTNILSDALSNGSAEG